MLTLCRTAALIAVIASAVQAQAPAPTGVVSSASFALAGLPSGPIAEGSIFAVFGANMGPSMLVQNKSLTLPTSAGLAGTTMSVTVGIVTAFAPMVFTSSGVVAGILPSNIPVGTGSLTVTYNNASGTVPITVVANNFSMYTLNGSGTGPAIVVDATNNNSLITTTNSAQAGDVVVLYGTGLGPLPTGQNDASNPPVQVNLTTPITVYVGTMQAVVAYHGRSGDAGLDQINFTIPAGLSGCNIPVIVQSGTGENAVASNSATISVAPTSGTTCSDSTGVPLSSITPNSNGTVNLGYLSMLQLTSSTPSGTTTTSTVSARFQQYTVQQLTASGSLTGQPSLGGCVVNYYNVGSSSSSVPMGIGLDAGPSIGVTGPASLNLTPIAGVGLYSAFQQGTFPSGSYTIAGPGGSNVGPFSTTIAPPPALTWTNSTSLINRSIGLTVNWTGGDPTGFVLIEGASSTGMTSGVGAAFICIAPNAESFTIPPGVLLQLPPSVQLPPSLTSPGQTTGSFTTGNFTNSQTFSATGLNYGYANAGSLTSVQVSYQ